MSGIAGAIFFDQAFSVTVGLMVSYFTGIMLLPILYLLVYRTGIRRKSWFSGIRIHNPLKAHTLDRFYDAGINWIFSHKTSSLLFCGISVPLCVVMFFFIRKERMPELDRNELAVRVEWKAYPCGWNSRRVDGVFKTFKKETVEEAAAVGEQDYLLNNEQTLSPSETELYFKTEKPSEIEPLQQAIAGFMKSNYPLAVVSFSPPETVFEKLFVTGEPDIVAELYARKKQKAPTPETLRGLERRFSVHTGYEPTGIAFENQWISYDQEKLLLYRVSYDELYRTLKTAFKENSVATLHSYQQYLPIVIAGEDQTVNEVLRNTLVQTQADKEGKVDYIPLNNLISVTPTEDLKTITAGRNGEYIPFCFYGVKDAESLVKQVKEEAGNTGDWDTAFSGSFFSNREMRDELLLFYSSPFVDDFFLQLI